MNEIAGPDGIVPMLLVYGAMPRCRMADLATKLQPNSERFRVMQSARWEYTTLINKDRTRRLLRKRVPPAVDRSLVVGEDIYVWREREKKYCGPYPILNISNDGSQVTISTEWGERSEVFSTDCIRPATDLLEVLMDQVSTEFDPHCTWKSCRANYTTSGEDVPIFVTEAVALTDERANGPQFTEPKKAEIRGPLERGTFLIVLREEVPQNSRVLKGRYVLAIKEQGISKEIFKAR